MKAMAVGELKTNFSKVLDEVKSGQEIEILYGRAKTPVAKIIPITATKESSLLGALQGKVNFTIADNWKMTNEELLNI